MGSQREQDHWFSFGDSCVVVRESIPANSAVPSRFSNGRSLFFLHGRYGHAGVWEPLMNLFSSQYRCLTLDFPGFGRSFSVGERVFSLLEHAVLVDEIVQKFISEEQVVLVGHDVGGGIAQLCAFRAPQKISALVLINSSGLTRKLGKISVGLQGYLGLWKLDRLLNQAHTMKPQWKEFLVQPWKKAASRLALLKSLRALDESWPWHYERQSWRHAIQNLKLPVLLLWGKNDPINPPEAGVELAQKIPEAYFYLHEKSGHWPSLEQPEWVYSKMKEFIFRTGAGTPPIKNAQKFLLR